MAAQSDHDKRVKIESLYERVRRSFTGIPELAVDELRALQAQENVQLVDVRTPAEQAVSMIPGAITAREFEDNRTSFEGATVVAYCTIGYRSGRYADKLRKDGFKVRNLAGSILLWAHQVGALAHNGKPTKKIHVGGEKWDLAPSAFEAIW